MFVLDLTSSQLFHIVGNVQERSLSSFTCLGCDDPNAILRFQLFCCDTRICKNCFEKVEVCFWFHSFFAHSIFFSAILRVQFVGFISRTKNLLHLKLMPQQKKLPDFVEKDNWKILIQKLAFNRSVL